MSRRVKVGGVPGAHDHPNATPGGRPLSRRVRPAWIIRYAGLNLPTDLFSPRPLPDYLSAYVCAAFRTRALARAALREIETAGRERPRIVKVWAYWMDDRGRLDSGG